MIENDSIWFHCVVPNPISHYRLICFPHAGGSAAFFRTWGTQLTDCEVYTIRYPGRAERIEESLPTDLRQLSLEIAAAIEPLAKLPIVLFGHSMGAVVALETARALEALGVSVAHLFASGSRQGPFPPRSEQIEEDDATLCKQLVEMGGTDPEAAVDPIFLELILPSVRADGKMFHSYEMELEPRLECPVTTIFGDADVHADIRPWRELSPKGFTEHCVPGDHFYLTSQPPFAILRKCIDAIADTSPPYHRKD